MKYAVIGNGELANQLKLFLGWKAETDVVVFDDNAHAAAKANAFLFADHVKPEFSDRQFIIGLGYKHLVLKQKIVSTLHAAGSKLITFVHPTSYVAAGSEIGPGTFVYPCCNIDKEVKIGKGCLINNSVIISHNNIINDCCYLSPGVVLSGNVTIGHSSFIGSGSIVANNITIGSNVVIGVGTVVTKDIPDGSHVIGNPMKILSKSIHLS